MTEEPLRRQDCSNWDKRRDLCPVCLYCCFLEHRHMPTSPNQDIIVIVLHSEGVLFAASSLLQCSRCSVFRTLVGCCGGVSIPSVRLCCSNISLLTDVVLRNLWGIHSSVGMMRDLQKNVALFIRHIYKRAQGKVHIILWNLTLFIVSKCCEPRKCSDQLANQPVTVETENL